MRLLNTATLDFEQFFDKKIPRYAILSHRWSDKEVSYQDYLRGRRKTGPGFKKIVGFCELAKSQQPSYEYVWIDTCCINKRNSTELAESINSMYRWYKNAGACFVYLRDLPSKAQSRKSERSKAFRESEWWRRGWTLQELLAPSDVIFCDDAWEVYGSKAVLAEEIAQITGIAARFLKGTVEVWRASAAMRMSWASQRQTTKPEDIAYCLLGLFEVNMPLLYGEGEKAFTRLQLEIIKRSDDESIFAWADDDLASWGMLAPSPRAFQDSGNVINFQLQPEQRKPYSMTNKGLLFWSASNTYASNEIDRSSLDPMGYDGHSVRLGCFYGNEEILINTDQGAKDMWEHGPLTIRLERVGPMWQRVDCGKLRQGRYSDLRKHSNGSFYGQGVQRAYYVEQPGL